jgi:hypothetical protein
MSANRSVIRQQLAAMLASAIPSAQTVFDHEPGDLGSASPVIVVSSASASRPNMTFQGNSATFMFMVDIYTLAAETASGSYTYADSADVVDACEAELAEFVASNQEIGAWNRIDYAGPSQIDFGLFNADGILRFRERVPLTITLFS